MTTEELKIWKRLNECEAVKKAKVGWMIGDGVFFNETYGFIDQIKETDYGIYIYCKWYDEEGSGTRDTPDFVDEHFIWVISLFDPIRTERSLIGIYIDIMLRKRFSKKSIERALKRIITLDRPDLALAKAIIEQEGK